MPSFLVSRSLAYGLPEVKCLTQSTPSTEHFEVYPTASYANYLKNPKNVTLGGTSARCAGRRTTLRGWKKFGLNIIKCIFSDSVIIWSMKQMVCLIH